jgi:putative lipoic acid-binding regulatory protein
VKAPAIEFPCEYPIKVLGKAHGLFRESVLAVVARYDAEFSPDRVQEKNSARGKYVSLTIWITATGETQLRDLFEDLKATGLVTMVL